jgi:cytochrome P450
MDRQPVTQLGPYDPDVRADPYPAFAALRRAGAAVWSASEQLWIVSRFADVRQVLRADGAMISGEGVAANPIMNRSDVPITLTSDGATHHRRRRVLQRPVMPAALKLLRPRLEAEAAGLVKNLADGEEHDAMASFASHLPVHVVSELVGLSPAGRGAMLRWAAASFDLMGPLNERGVAAVPQVEEMMAFVDGLGPDQLAPGGWAAQLFDAVEAGELSSEEARFMAMDYIGPALDTTILATGHMVWLLARNSGALGTLRAEPALIPGTINEIVRLASPVRGFTRLAAEDLQLGETLIPKGDRVLVLFASANHDETRYPEPERFDLRRNPVDHVGWGYGPHLCAGMHLARLELEILLRELVRQVSRIEVGEPVPATNNVLQGFKVLPARFHPM